MVYFLNIINKNNKIDFEFDYSNNQFNADLQVIISRSMEFSANEKIRDSKSIQQYKVYDINALTLSNQLLKRKCLKEWLYSIENEKTIEYRIQRKLEEL